MVDGVTGIYLVCVTVFCLCLPFLRLRFFGFRLRMGQSNSLGKVLSPLECMIKNFSDFKTRAEGYGVTVDAFTLRRFCEREWPTFRVGWPTTGTLDMGPCAGVRRIAYETHPDQIPYIDIWIDIIYDRPKWLQQCGCTPKKKLEERQPRPIFVARPPPAPKKQPPAPPVLETVEEEAPPPPPYALHKLGEGQDKARQKGSLAPVPDSSTGDGEPLSPPHTRAGTSFGEARPATQLPLRETGERDSLGCLSALMCPLPPRTYTIGKIRILLSPQTPKG